MARKIIQMLERDNGLHVLCDDSSIWRLDRNGWYEVDVEQARHDCSMYGSENDDVEFNEEECKK